jgi:hypothetical protein
MIAVFRFKRGRRPISSHTQEQLASNLSFLPLLLRSGDFPTTPTCTYRTNSFRTVMGMPTFLVLPAALNVTPALIWSILPPRHLLGQRVLSVPLLLLICPLTLRHHLPPGIHPTECKDHMILPQGCHPARLVHLIPLLPKTENLLHWLVRSSRHQHCQTRHVGCF